MHLIPLTEDSLTNSYKKCLKVTHILGRALVLLLAVLGGVPLHGGPAGV